MKVWSTRLAVLLAGASTVAAMPVSSDREQAGAVAIGFYRAYATFRPSDGIPDARQRARLEPFISTALDRLLVDGDAAEQHFAAVTRHMSPPLIEGDLFTSNFEGATAWNVGPCEVDADSAHCTVALGYRSRKREDARPVNWTDTVCLVHTAEGWRVDDIAYGAKTAFGNKGRLTQTLRDAIRDGNSATQ